MGQIIQIASRAASRRIEVREAHNPAIRTDAVYVVFTSVGDTFAAARVAADLAKALGVPATIVHFRTVPYALPVGEPNGMSPVETDAFITRLRAEGLDLRVRVYLCRDGRRAIPLAFKAHSLIVVAGRRRWWPTESERWRRTLEAAGHFVVFVDKSERSARDPREDSEPSGAAQGEQGPGPASREEERSHA